MIPEDDRGLLLGDGLFETILAEDGTLRHFERHLERMSRGCALMGLDPPTAEAARALAETAVEEAGMRRGRAVVRLTLTAGSGRGLDRPAGTVQRLFASAAPSPRPQGPARLVTVDVRRNEGSPASRLKTLAYVDNVLARRQARAAGGEEALMLNNAGEIASAAAANLFWLKEGRLFTPALDCGVLSGIMRARVMEIAPGLGLEVGQARASRTALDEAEGLFLTNSLIGVRPVFWLDGRDLPVPAVVEALAAKL